MDDPSNTHRLTRGTPAYVITPVGQELFGLVPKRTLEREEIAEVVASLVGGQEFREFSFGRVLGVHDGKATISDWEVL